MRALWTTSKHPRLGPSRAEGPGLFDSKPVPTGAPLLLSVDLLDEDPHNPRTDFPDADLDELTEDIRQHGVLQPIVVRADATSGRYRVRLGAKRLRAAKRAGLSVVPVTIGNHSIDAYAQVAENQKRHGLSPLDLARFIRGRVDDGESNADIARRLGMNLTTVAHHLALLDLPPVLEDALQSGRCTSPRTLHELSKLHGQQFEQVRALVDGQGDITRAAVATLRERMGSRAALSSTKLIVQAAATCERLERLLGRIGPLVRDDGGADLAALRAKVAALSSWPRRDSDGQTP